MYFELRITNPGRRSAARDLFPFLMRGQQWKGPSADCSARLSGFSPCKEVFRVGASLCWGKSRSDVHARGLGAGFNEAEPEASLPCRTDPELQRVHPPEPPGFECRGFLPSLAIRATSTSILARSWPCDRCDMVSCFRVNGVAVRLSRRYALNWVVLVVAVLVRGSSSITASGVVVILGRL